MSNCRVPASKMPREATPLTLRTVPRSVASGSASTATSTVCPGETLALSCSASLAVTSTLRRVDDFGDRLPGERRVADAVVGHRAAEVDAAERLEIRAHSDDAVKRRADVQALDVALGDLHRQLRLVALLPHAVARCLVVSRWVLTSASSWASRCFASSSVRTFCSRLDRADQLVAQQVELGAPDVVAGVQQRDFVVGDLHGRLRVGLDDLLLGELQIEPCLLEIELLFGGVEFDDDVARS